MRALAVLFFFLIAMFLYAMAHAQINHERFHAHYQNWVNQNGAGCCNDHDCGELAGDNERTVAGRIEVRIEGAWCPVLDHHYLKRGNAPDWSTAHVCVQPNYAGVKTSPCDRLLCYQPRPGT
jgi:hypothetical protein